jgi:hypothetical protein
MVRTSVRFWVRIACLVHLCFWGASAFAAPSGQVASAEIYSPRGGGEHHGEDGVGSRPCGPGVVSLPHFFILNRGQLPRDILFYEKNTGSGVFFTREGVSFAMRGADGRYLPAGRVRPQKMGSEMHVEGESPLIGKVHYLLGNAPQRWYRDIPTYASVLYQDAYPGIDIRFYRTTPIFEYDVVVHPGADPAQVRMEVGDARSFELSPDGTLVVQLASGATLTHGKPSIYQFIDGQKREIAGRFRVYETAQEVSCEGERHPGRGDALKVVYGFEVGRYDERHSLIIDPPLLSYASFLGGTEDDYAYDIALDQAENIYITGETASSDFPAGSSHEGVFAGGGSDVFVVKLDPTGSTMLYSAFLGGNDKDRGYSLAVGKNGYVYVAGLTYSADFPVLNAVQTALAGWYDAFVVALDTSGGGLVYATYLGGSKGDAAYALALDESGRVLVTGVTGSSDFPLANPLQSKLGGGNDVFLARLSPSGQTLLNSTYWGGKGNDFGRAIGLDSIRNVYVAGHTASVDFPLFPKGNSLQPQFGGGNADAFVSKFNAGISAAAFSTYLGGTAHDAAWGLSVDSEGRVSLTGDTNSTDFPTVNALQPSFGGGSMDAFVCRLDAAGTGLIFSTYLGGGAPDYGRGTALDAQGYLLITGETASTDFPLVNPLQTKHRGLGDVFLTRLAPSGEVLAYSTYLGAVGWEWGHAVAVDATGKAFIVGATNSAYFPTKDPFQRTMGGGADGFVAKVAPTTRYTITASTGANGGSIQPSGKVAVSEGDDQDFMFYPNPNYCVANVVVDGESVGNPDYYTFYDVGAKHTIWAYFKLVSHTVTASAGEHGNITPLGEVSIKHGGTKSFNIVTEEDYHTADVLVDGMSVGAVKWYTFENVTKNHTIHATFALDTHKITATAWTNGRITPSGTVIVDHGSDQAFTITPHEGYEVADIVVDGTSVGAVTSYVFHNVVRNHTIRAGFRALKSANGEIPARRRVLLAANERGLDTAVDVVPELIPSSLSATKYTITASAGDHGSIIPSGAVLVTAGGSKAFTIDPDDNYTVKDVKVDGISVGVKRYYYFQNVTTDHTIEASFALKTYTISVIVKPNGKIVPPGKLMVSHGGSQTFIITPNDGYVVIDVKVDGISVGSVTSYTIDNVTGPHTIVAHFGRAPLTVTATAGENGAISPAGTSTVPRNTQISYDIFPDEGFHVEDVLVDGKSVTPRTRYSFKNVTENHSIHAKFAQNESPDYLIGTFGVPTGDWSLLRLAGFNLLLVGEGDFHRSRAYSLKKLYSFNLGKDAVPDIPSLTELFDHYSSLGDVYGYYLFGDVNLERRHYADELRAAFGLASGSAPHPMVGIESLSGDKGNEEVVSQNFNTYEGFIYYYPLMRRGGMSLAHMLEIQKEIAEDRRQAGRSTYLDVQAVWQDWYAQIIKLNEVDSRALLYPDGQVLRMLIHYAVATGANGYRLYSADEVSGDDESDVERLPAAAQATLEMKPLRWVMSQAIKKAEFFSLSDGSYGTLIRTPTVDVYFIFYADQNSYYHPSIASLQSSVSAVMNVNAYQSVRQYSPMTLKNVTAADALTIRQDEALVLIGLKEGGSEALFELSAEDKQSLATILDQRVGALRVNLQIMGVSALPAVPSGFSNLEERLTKLLAHLDTLNETKRNAWLARLSDLPTDGQILNSMYLNGLLNNPYPVGAINFYYHE